MNKEEAIEHLAESDQDGFYYWITNNKELLGDCLKTLGHSKANINKAIKAIDMIEEIEDIINDATEGYNE